MKVPLSLLGSPDFDQMEMFPSLYGLVIVRSLNLLSLGFLDISLREF